MTINDSLDELAKGKINNKFVKCRYCKYWTGEIVSFGILCTKLNIWRNEKQDGCEYFEEGKNDSEERQNKYMIKERRELYKK